LINTETVFNAEKYCGGIKAEKVDRNNPVEILSLGSLFLYRVIKAEKYCGGIKAE
jgi:hypothetical protein